MDEIPAYLVSCSFLSVFVTSKTELIAKLGDQLTIRLHGACIGAGIELPAFASRVEADSETWFQLPEVSFGLVPGAGGTVSILKRIGRARLAAMALTGDPLDAATALEWGLIDEIRST